MRYLKMKTNMPAGEQLSRRRGRTGLTRLFLLFSVFIWISCDSKLSELFASESPSIFALNPASEYDPLMQALKGETGQATSLLWFTDVHENRANLKRILSWYDHYQACYDGIIALGDQQNMYFTDDFSWWAEDGASKVMQVVGNHDAWISKSIYEEGNYEGQVVRGYGKGNPFYIISQKDVYAKFFAPYIASWGVIQPDGAASIGACYYYKDYGKVRLVVVDCKHYGTVDDMDENNLSYQDRWLEGVLEDAREKGLAVMVASHYSPAAATLIPCAYTRKEATGLYSDRLDSAAYKKVARFIDKGGEFVCWMSGHGHYDEIGVLEADPRQLLIRCATANHNRGKSASRHVGTKSQDSFNCISVDTDAKLVYIVKVGADENEDGTRKRILRYRYRDFTDDAGQTHERGLLECD